MVQPPKLTTHPFQAISGDLFQTTFRREANPEFLFLSYSNYKVIISIDFTIFKDVGKICIFFYKKTFI